MRLLSIVLSGLLAAVGFTTPSDTPTVQKTAKTISVTHSFDRKPVTRSDRYNAKFDSARSRSVKTATVLAYARWFAKRKLNYTHEQWVKVRWMWYQESRWNWDAVNPTSGAAGIAQMKTTSKITHPFRQVELGFKYIEHRYGGPDAAYAHWLKNRSY